MASTTRSTVNRLACEELHTRGFILKSCGTRTIKGGTYTTSSRSSIRELQETKNFFKQANSFFEVKLWRLRRKTCQSKYDNRDKNLPTRTVLANSSNHGRARPHNIEICKQATRSQYMSYSVSQNQKPGDLKTYLAIEVSQNNALTHGKLDEATCRYKQRKSCRAVTS